MGIGIDLYEKYKDEVEKNSVPKPEFKFFNWKVLSNNDYVSCLSPKGPLIILTKLNEQKTEYKVELKIWDGKSWRAMWYGSYKDLNQKNKMLEEFKETANIMFGHPEM